MLLSKVAQEPPVPRPEASEGETLADVEED